MPCWLNQALLTSLRGHVMNINISGFATTVGDYNGVLGKTQIKAERHLCRFLQDKKANGCLPYRKCGFNR